MDKFVLSEQDTRCIYKKCHWNFQSPHQKADVSTKRKAGYFNIVLPLFYKTAS